MAEIAAPAAAARAAAEQDEERRRRAPPGKDATPEERARYELERKKVAKYKEDKLKARRDHTRMILESHAQAKRRQLLGKQSEFLANLAFRNSLPDLPFDTKFLQYPHERERCGCFPINNTIAAVALTERDVLPAGSSSTSPTRSRWTTRTRCTRTRRSDS